MAGPLNGASESNSENETIAAEVGIADVGKEVSFPFTFTFLVSRFVPAGRRSDCHTGAPYMSQSTLAAAAFFAAGFTVWTSTDAAPAETAEYRVSFIATWSSETHPTNFPSNAHFSPLIGATHGDAYSVWMPGGMASNGVEQMAETGSTGILTFEVNAAVNAGTAGQRITGGSIAVSPGGPVNGVFTVSQDFPRASVVTMIAPSPDWFIGTRGLDLFSRGAWADEIVVELQPWDAGTDSGINYTSGNNNTNPQEPISLITGFPLADGDGNVAPLGTFTFTRINVPACDTDLDQSGATDFQDLVMLLAAWGPCPGGCAADIDGNEDVGFSDLLSVLAAFGGCP